jgi:hypothetical protein
VDSSAPGCGRTGRDRGSARRPAPLCPPRGVERVRRPRSLAAAGSWSPV